MPVTREEIFFLLFHTTSVKGVGGTANLSNFDVSGHCKTKIKETVHMHRALLCKAVSHEDVS